MRWPWQNRPDPPPIERDTRGIEEAQAALDDALDTWPDVREVTSQLRGIRRRNHLAEITEQALRGNR